MIANAPVAAARTDVIDLMLRARQARDAALAALVGRALSIVGRTLRGHRSPPRPVTA